jgi:hypothetical protein
MKRPPVHSNIPPSRIHPVEGYPDNENMWERLWNLEKADAMPSLKHLNHRTEFLFYVNESKQFKVKKNPHYRRILKELTIPGGH